MLAKCLEQTLINIEGRTSKHEPSLRLLTSRLDGCVLLMFVLNRRFKSALLAPHDMWRVLCRSCRRRRSDPIFEKRHTVQTGHGAPLNLYRKAPNSSWRVRISKVAPRSTPAMPSSPSWVINAWSVPHVPPAHRVPKPSGTCRWSASTNRSGLRVYWSGNWVIVGQLPRSLQGMFRCQRETDMKHIGNC